MSEISGHDRVDGFDSTTNTVYEFNGCLWHGCCSCFPELSKYSKLNLDRTMAEMREYTKAKEEKLRNAGYNLQIIWECEWDKMVKNDEELQSFLCNLELVEPLNPRDAFFGGRTNAVKLHHEADLSKGEQIHYVDVTSLYPTVNKYDEYPIGHPQIITKPTDQNIASHFGVAKVTILPPRQLYHPVLPFRNKGKLTFPLCRSCLESEMEKNLLSRTEKCGHDETQRAILGTWCTSELLKAVDCGYIIQSIHEVWHFPPNQRKSGLFADYVNTWLRIKQESCGYPSHTTTSQQKAQYVVDYRRIEGVQLNTSTIAKNPGRKQTAKLGLNSFWGKFGENLQKASTQSITAPHQLYEILKDTTRTINSIRICTDDLLEVVTTPIREDIFDNGKVNIFIAAFTTCHARLRLYQHLSTLNERVLYFDTDSVIYSAFPNEETIPLGDYQGEMTNELNEGDYIVDFTSGGPKNYGYITKNGKTCCKVRGFSLNSVRGSSQLNYQIMRDNLLKELLDPLPSSNRTVDVTKPNHFLRNPQTKTISVVPQTKQYALVFDKRVVDRLTFKSYPFGYSAN